MMAAAVALSSAGSTPLTLQAAEADVIGEEFVLEEGADDSITEDAVAGGSEADIEEEVFCFAFFIPPFLSKYAVYPVDQMFVVSHKRRMKFIYYGRIV